VAKSRETKQSIYGSAEALRHPKAAIQWSFSQPLESCCKRQQELQLAGEVYFSRTASK
jgi:hypothetical protein